MYIHIHLVRAYMDMHALRTYQNVGTNSSRIESAAVTFVIDCLIGAASAPIPVSYITKRTRTCTPRKVFMTVPLSTVSLTWHA